jgi:uncharacterized membrane protein
MLFLNIATGVILVLLGMRYLRKGLDRLFGNQLVEWLQRTPEQRNLKRIQEAQQTLPLCDRCSGVG